MGYRIEVMDLEMIEGPQEVVWRWSP